MILAIQGALAAVTVWFAAVFGMDFMKHKDNLEADTSWGKMAFVGFITDFFDTLGIGSFAPTVALSKALKQVHDRVMPGTLNVAHTIPVVVEALIFITIIEVDPITLVSMLVSATLGAWLGAGFVAKLPEKKIQFFMGIALFVTAFIMLAGKMGWMPGGGDAIGLTGGALIAGNVGNFILGALMTAGIGLYAPCMALVYILGMSAKVAFPIMMASCAFLMPVASVKFIKEGAYDKKASMAITIFGTIGVFIAAYLVKSLPLDILRWIVIAVILYTSVTMIRRSMNNTEAAGSKAEAK